MSDLIWTICPVKRMYGEGMVETSMYVAFDRFERDYQAMLNAAPTTSLTSETNTEVGE